MDETDPAPPVEKGRKQTTGAVKAAWKRTLQEMDELAEERRGDGWEVTTVRADHTDPVTRDMGDHDRFGLSHVVSKSHGERFVDAFDEEAFTDFLVYGTTVDARRFAVTELLDTDEERSIMIANEYPFERARGLAETAEREGRLYTYVRKINGTILGTFEHEEYEPLLPQPGE